MRRKAHGERFSLRGEWQNSRAAGQNHARKGKVCSGNAKLARRQTQLARRKPGVARGKENLLGGTSSSLGERRSLGEEWQNSRAEGKAPPFEFLPLLSTCPLGGHATPWFTAPWISAPLASLFLDFFHPLNSCHLLVLHSFTPAYWVSDYPFFDSRHLRFLKAVCASFPIPPPHSTFVFPLCPATKKTAKISIFLPCKIEKF